VNGRFYEVPDNHLDSLWIPAERVQEKLEAAGAGGGGGGRRGGGGGKCGPAPQVFIQVFGSAKVRRGGAPVAPREKEEGVSAYQLSSGYCGLRCFSYCGSYRGNHCGYYCG